MLASVSANVVRLEAFRAFCEGEHDERAPFLRANSIPRFVVHQNVWIGTSSGMLINEDNLYRTLLTTIRDDVLTELRCLSLSVRRRPTSIL